MGYNGYTPKKKASNERYLATLKSFQVRLKEEDFKKLDIAAEQAGMSRNAFVLEAIKEKIDNL